MRRLIIAHETTGQLGGSAHLLWVRLTPDGWLLHLQSAIRSDGGWLVYLGLSWVIQWLCFMRFFLLQWTSPDWFSHKGRSSREWVKSLFPKAWSQTWYPSLLQCSIGQNKSQVSSDSEWENKLHSLMEGSISHFAKMIYKVRGRTEAPFTINWSQYLTFK